MLNYYDNLLPLDETVSMYNSILTRPFFYGEADRVDTAPTGLLSPLDSNDPIYIRLTDILKQKMNLESLQRSYINLFRPGEYPLFHKDGKGTTCLFYINPETALDEGGETQFVINDNITGIVPKPGRLCVFDGLIEHRATSFRTIPRITIAFKFTESWPSG